MDSFSWYNPVYKNFLLNTTGYSYPLTTLRCSQVSHHRPTLWKRTNPIDWDKATVVDREAQRQTGWIKEALWIRMTPICMNRDAVSYQLSHTWDQVISRSRAPSSCKQSTRRDQDVRRTSKRYQ